MTPDVPNNMSELKQFCEKVRAKVPPGCGSGLIHSYRNSQYRRAMFRVITSVSQLYSNVSLAFPTSWAHYRFASYLTNEKILSNCRNTANRYLQTSQFSCQCVSK